MILGDSALIKKIIKIKMNPLPPPIKYDTVGQLRVVCSLPKPDHAVSRTHRAFPSMTFAFQETYLWNAKLTVKVDVYNCTENLQTLIVE